MIMDVLTLAPIAHAAGRVRLPGSKRFASERKRRREGIEVADELLARIEKLAA